MPQVAIKERRRRLLGMYEPEPNPFTESGTFAWKQPGRRSCAIERKYSSYLLSRQKAKKAAPRRNDRFASVVELASKVAAKRPPNSAILEWIKSLVAEQKFEKLADEWEQQTSLLSSPTRKAMHPSYRQIVKMKWDAVPLILQRMKRRGGHWFWALSEITKESPIPKSVHGRIPDMREAWLKWGSKRGYC